MRNPAGYWTYERCKEIAEQCISGEDMKRKSRGAFNASRKNGWIENYSWYHKNISEPKWTYENCIELAKKCKSKKEFNKLYPKAYLKSKEKCWINDYTWLKDYNHWTYETCISAAKECKTRVEFTKKYPGANGAAIKNGWIDDYVWLIKKEKKPKKESAGRIIKWTYDTCKEAAKQCIKVSEFKKRYPGAYSAAFKNGWMTEYTWLKIMKNINVMMDDVDNVYAYLFTDMNTIYIGRTIHIKDRDHDHRNEKGSAVYRFAKKNNTNIPDMTILETGLTLMEGQEREDFYVKKYKSEGWNVLNTGSTGIGKGSLGGICQRHWTYEKCYDAAKKCNRRKDFKEQYPKQYEAARSHNWIKDYIWFKKYSR